MLELVVMKVVVVMVVGDDGDVDGVVVVVGGDEGDGGGIMVVGGD